MTTNKKVRTKILHFRDRITNLRKLPSDSEVDALQQRTRHLTLLCHWRKSCVQKGNYLVGDGGVENKPGRCSVAPYEEIGDIRLIQMNL